MHISIEKKFGAEVQALLDEHLGKMSDDSPPESMHALPLGELQAGDITFWCAWEHYAKESPAAEPVAEGLMGFAALKQLQENHAELKSMRTHKNFVRRGVAAALLTEILRMARARGIKRISLETGSMASFAPAHALYREFGFEPCQPFADYLEDPLSIFMTLDLS